MIGLQWCQHEQQESPIIKVPLQFTFPPVEAISKELTKLGSVHEFRISYLGPRWDNSLQFHKKYSPGNYQFKEKRVNKNSTFLHDSMTHNQFYKNEIYYRAFQGMNPTINKSEEVCFQSRFEGGNLDCAVRISECEYDLFLRIDSNTRGNIFWYYFTVKNSSKAKKIKFNICNLTKSDTHYKKGLQPFVYSHQIKEWQQDLCTNVTFREKKLRYEFIYQRMNVINFYELSFTIEFKQNQEFKFAYCIPYGYSQLLKDLSQLPSIAEVATLGQTLTGLNIPIVMVGKNDETYKKPVLLITGRVHPGQSNSSIIISNLMKFICCHPEARFLREKVLTVIVPMLNPDGVVLGNSRSGASGKDLNRQFKTKARTLFPQVFLLKNLVDRITETHEMEMYLDFHGHSRKKNMFIFGPNYNVTQPEYYKCRVFPRILSTLTPIFRYYSCSYDIPNDKRSTARAVMLGEMFIPFVYTVESSLGYYHDYNMHKDVPFTQKKWEQIGEHVGLALKEYYQGLQQYEVYLETKRKAKKALIQQIRTNANINSVQLLGSMSPVSRKTGQRQMKKDNKEVKLLKIFQQIKQLEERKSKQVKLNDSENDDSDSHNQDEQLQKEKMYQFTGMVSECVQFQESRKFNSNIQKFGVNFKKKEESHDKSKRNKLKLRKLRQIRLKEEQNLLNEIEEENKIKFKRSQIRTQNKNRNFIKEPQVFLKSEVRKEVVSEELKKVTPRKKDCEISKQRRRLLSSHQFTEDEVDFISVEKKANKMNVRMFNFSKMVQNPKSLRYQDTRQYGRNKIESKSLGSGTRVIVARRDSQARRQSEFLFECQSKKPNFINLEEILEDGSQEIFTALGDGKRHTDQVKHFKGKIGFPPSFYRIKYHNNQRRKNETRKQKNLYDYDQFQRISQFNFQNNLNSISTIGQKEQRVIEAVHEDTDRKDGLFIKVKKFPVL